MSISHLGELAALATAVCWTVTAMAFESAGKRIGSLSVNLTRLVIAFFLLSIFCLFARGKAFPLDASAHTWIWLALSGVVGFAIGDLCLFRALVLVGSRVSMLLMALVPPYTAVMGWILLGERLTLFNWLGMILTISGVVWVIMERQTSSAQIPAPNRRKGLVLGIIGGFGQSVGLILSKMGMGDYNPFAATQIRVLAGIVCFSVLFVFIGWWPKVISSLSNKEAMSRTALGGIFGPFLGVSLSLVAVQNTEAGIAATIMALVPVFIIIPSVLIKKERVTFRAIIGSSIAVSGTALLFL